MRPFTASATPLNPITDGFAQKLIESQNDPDRILALFREHNLNTEELLALRAQPDSDYPYSRMILLSHEHCEVMVAFWAFGKPSAPHNHGSSKGWIFYLEGDFEERSYEMNDGELVETGLTHHAAGTYTHIQNQDIHSCMSRSASSVSLHVYFPRIQDMHVFDVKARKTLVVSDECGAWIPRDSDQVLSQSDWFISQRLGQPSFILILYTTLYREGGAKFRAAAEVLAAEKRVEFSECQVICKAVEQKAAFIEEFNRINAIGSKINELHFIGHSGLYGIMFGTTAWPEQLSPYEWRHLSIPFAANAKAYFHACRTGRWFAPFFARTFQVKTYGHFWYTTVSRRAERFAWEGLNSQKRPLYIISVPGKKSHGFLGSAKKYVLRPRRYPMTEFLPHSAAIDTTYDSVAPLYDETFEDISVRADELKWLRTHLKEHTSTRLLDIGCGTGSFMRAISDLVEHAHGVDLSTGMISQAQQRSVAEADRLSFSKIDGPHLPFPDNSFDVITSVLSFRYLDWDPIVSEILRVLKPGGQLLVIDMVAAPVKWNNWPRFVFDKVKQQLTQLRRPQYRKALNKMVTDNRWKKMLEYNPMRAEHELKWYLESRFPGGKSRVINYAWHSRVIAFKSPPVFHKKVEKLSYP